MKSRTNSICTLPVSMKRWTRDAALGAAALAVATGCLTRPIGVDEPQTTNLIVDNITQTAVDKIDLLFMIDNSISMADKQVVLADAVPVLVSRLVNPVCIGGDGSVTTTTSPDDDCPAGAAREFPPLKDIHVGIITSSLGDGGANKNCVYDATDADSAQKVDNGYLLGTLPRGGAVEPGFLEWTGAEGATFETSFRDQVKAAGEFGCGYEASLEAWYHFLIDPTPWMSIDVADCTGQAAGSGNCRRPNIPANTDGTFGDPFILRQRAAFLRANSLVAIVMVTDENDCSIINGGPFNLVAQTGVMMFRGSDQCATAPNDPCCYSCGTGQPAACTDGCTEANGGKYVPSALDEPNLRCFEQKRRFGLDFLYPTQRYVNALTQTELGLCRIDLDPSQCAAGENAANPLLAPPGGGLPRDKSLVFLAGIVGVPWQLLKAEASQDGRMYPADELHFLSNAQLIDRTLGAPPWDKIVDDPAMPDPSMRDRHMLESIASDTVMGRAGLPTKDSAPGSDPIHGHEWSAESADDLQYACIFPLPEPRDCNGPDFTDGKRGCDCRGADDAAYTEGNPLCYSGGGYGSTQVAAKAYPGLRELDTLRRFGDVSGNAIVASICARNVAAGEKLKQDYGYNPAIGAIVDRLKEKLGGRCLSRTLDVEEIMGIKRGKPACSIVEVSTEPAGGCSCDDAKFRHNVNPKVAEIVSRKICGGVEPCVTTGLCLCEMIPAGGTVNAENIVEVTDQADYEECQTVENPNVDGWCYVDRDIPVITGSEAAEAAKNALVADCPAAEKRLLRFVGEGALANGSTTYVACKGASIKDRVAAP